MLRILVGHESPAASGIIAGRYDIQCVQRTPDGRCPASIAEMLPLCPPGWRPDVYYHAGAVFFPIPTDIETFNGLTVSVINDWHHGGRAIWGG